MLPDEAMLVRARRPGPGPALRRLEHTPPFLVGLVAAAASIAFYVPGWDRAFSWDASNTVGNFVATPSLLDPFRRQVTFNNQVLFSALDHVVYTVTGSRDERVLRLLPIALAAIAIAVLAGFVARRWGVLAGAVAGAVVISNPLAATEFREARGYSLLVLAAVLGTGLLLRWVDGPTDRRRTAALYVVVTAVGIATHLYMLPVLVVHAALVADDRATLRRWLPLGLSAAVLGLAPVSLVLAKDLARDQHPFFDAWFPLRFTYEMLGGQPLAFVLLAPLAGIGLWRVRSSTRVRRVALTVAGLVVAVWLASPAFVYSRFFLWVLPPVAILIATVVARRPVLVVLVLVAVSVQVATQAPHLGQSQVPNRLAAGYVIRAQRAGWRTCAIGSTKTTLAAYVTGFTVVGRADQFRSCDLVAAAEGPFDATLVRTAARRFPYHLELPAKEPGAVFATRPISLVAPPHGG